MAVFVYRCLMLLLAPVLVIVLLLRSITQQAYRHRLTERFGFITSSLKPHSIVIHAASVGEVLALKPFIEQLTSQQPEQLITLTCFTPTGSAQITRLYADISNIQHCYFPLDIWPCHALFLSRLKPKAMLLMETELWPSILHQAAANKIPLMLFNGRLSDNSVKQYLKLKPLISSTLQQFSTIAVQDANYLERFITLGAKPEHCSITGNIKYDIKQDDSLTAKQAELATLCPKTRKIWLLASSHDGDEQFAITVFKQVKQHFSDLLLILVPRHPERFETVYQQAVAEQLNVQKRSSNEPVAAQTEVWILDTLGELTAAYSLPDVVTVAGSFSHIGGHNPLEPALYKKPIIVGADMKNFRDINEQMLSAKGLIKLDGEQDVSAQLAQHVEQLLQQPDLAKQLGDNAYQVLTTNQGAVHRTLALFNQIKPD